MIGSYIREIREEKGYLLRQMAALLDIDSTILSKMEREERLFKRESVIKVAEICEVEEKTLLTMWLADKINKLVKGEEYVEEALELVKRQNR